MKKILFVCLFFLCFQASAHRIMIPNGNPPNTICTDSGWTELIVKKKVHPHNYFESHTFCIVPDGQYYNPYILNLRKNDQLKHLFELYLGLYPSMGQIKKAKKQMKKDGYVVD